jgi:hypothetical protein
MDFMGLDLKLGGRRFCRSPRLYVEALVLKEICKVSLRYAGNHPSSVLEFLNLHYITGRLGMEMLWRRF